MAARRFIMYLPDNNRFGRHIDDIEEWVREACFMLTTINGGATRLPPAQGMWLKEDDNQLIEETTHIVYSFVQIPAFLQNFGAIRSFIARFGRETGRTVSRLNSMAPCIFCPVTPSRNPNARSAYLM
jgi:hypothetical protein